MLEQNYIQKRVLNNAMKDRNIGRVLGLEKRKNAVLEVMTQQGIKTDISKLPEYKKKAFVKAVTKITGIGYETRKAIQSVYGNKPQEIKPKVNAIDDDAQAKRKRYEEIMNKGKGISSVEKNRLPYGESKMPSSKVLEFGVSNKGLRKADGMLVKAEESGSVMDRLKNIQS